MRWSQNQMAGKNVVMKPRGDGIQFLRSCFYLPSASLLQAASIAPSPQPRSPGQEVAWTRGQAPTAGHRRRASSEAHGSASAGSICSLSSLQDQRGVPTAPPAAEPPHGGEAASSLKNGFAGPTCLCSAVIHDNIHSKGTEQQGWPLTRGPVLGQVPGASAGDFALTAAPRAPGTRKGGRSL